jgi:hypothetical protein
MSFLIADVPFTYCKVRREFVRDHKDGHGQYEDCVVFGMTALEGRLPSFNVMMQNGAQWARLPIHAFVNQPCEPLAASTVCLWDCLSYTMSVHAYAYLGTLVADVFCTDGKTRRGTYAFTVDWCQSDYSEMPDQHKCHHFLWLDEGQLCAMPNNRLRWHEPSWIKPFTDRPDYLVQTREWTAERERAVINGDRQFYTVAGEK